MKVGSAASVEGENATLAKTFSKPEFSNNVFYDDDFSKL